MNYKRLAQIDNEIDTIEENLSVLNQDCCHLLKGQLNCMGNKGSIMKPCYFDRNFVFEIAKETLIDKFNNKKRLLKDEKKKLLGKTKWYHF